MCSWHLTCKVRLLLCSYHILRTTATLPRTTLYFCTTLCLHVVRPWSRSTSVNGVLFGRLHKPVVSVIKKYKKHMCHMSMLKNVKKMFKRHVKRHFRLYFRHFCSQSQPVSACFSLRPRPGLITWLGRVGSRWPAPIPWIVEKRTKLPVMLNT